MTTLEKICAEVLEKAEKATKRPWANEDGCEIISTVEHDSPCRPFPVVANTTVQWKDHERHFENAEYIVTAANNAEKLARACQIMFDLVNNNAVSEKSYAAHNARDHCGCTDCQCHVTLKKVEELFNDNYRKT